MNRDYWMAQVRPQLKENRWQHTLGVASTAVNLADRYGVDPDQAWLAAILHDYAKNWELTKQEETIRTYGGRLDLLAYDHQLWHAEAAALVAEHELKIDNDDVIAAIRYHTSGRERMSLLEKIICLADYIEPGRVYNDVEMIREQAKISLDSALILAFESTLRFLIDRGKLLYPLTVLARNDLIRQAQHTPSDRKR